MTVKELTDILSTKNPTKPVAATLQGNSHLYFIPVVGVQRYISAETGAETVVILLKSTDTVKV